MSQKIMSRRKTCISLFGVLVPLLAFGFAGNARAGDTCFCHNTGSGSNTICTDGSAADTHRDNHGDQPFGCECGDGICYAAGGEDCFTCPQDCGACPGCGDGVVTDPEECDGSNADCAGITNCSGDGSACECDGCRCAPICVVDGVCNGSEDCGNCSADCGECPVCGNGITEDGEECDDGNADNGDCCDNNCTFTANSCGDGNVCNGDEVCANGSCQAGEPLNCSDGNACTEDSCDSVGGCQYSDVVCTDGDTCTTDTCNPATGCEFPTLSCDDGDACTSDSCEAGLGCQYAAADCDDGLDCTDDACDPAQGCIHAPDDGSCDDGDPCTADTCDPSEGCVFTGDAACDGEDGVLSGGPDGGGPSGPGPMGVAAGRNCHLIPGVNPVPGGGSLWLYLAGAGLFLAMIRAFEKSRP